MRAALALAFLLVASAIVLQPAADACNNITHGCYTTPNCPPSTPPNVVNVVPSCTESDHTSVSVDGMTIMAGSEDADGRETGAPLPLAAGSGSEPFRAGASGRVWFHVRWDAAPANRTTTTVTLLVSSGSTDLVFHGITAANVTMVANATDQYAYFPFEVSAVVVADHTDVNFVLVTSKHSKAMGSFIVPTEPTRVESLSPWLFGFGGGALGFGAGGLVCRRVHLRRQRASSTSTSATSGSSSTGMRTGTASTSTTTASDDPLRRT